MLCAPPSSLTACPRGIGSRVHLPARRAKGIVLASGRNRALLGPGLLHSTLPSAWARLPRHRHPSLSRCCISTMRPSSSVLSHDRGQTESHRLQPIRSFCTKVPKYTPTESATSCLNQAFPI
ncbi:hypothetical protein PVAP13_3NG215300 [Panicum virgatum]|uniref:Uncharacterized protein n=1 Tax=Panicum virgatum TaxID=38727 RepID=A0A8T0UHF9_PANVG|nr:hypothetical protein PVAP13_3NG215300 [Panicum virgatum]KAG2620525.1 hypothetical protein PVAP13_3NG215300 [Panicum virgatum]KAG2620526.1 hypothetical protein PVAP13_3NG215300 [Panicum virgatum]